MEIDCREIFAPGQLGVAIGRAKTSDGLRILHFNKKLHLIPPSKVVLNFLDLGTTPFSNDKSCCFKPHKSSGYKDVVPLHDKV